MAALRNNMWSLRCFTCLTGADQWPTGETPGFYEAQFFRSESARMMILRMHQLALSFVSEREITSTSDEANLCRNPNKITVMKPFRSSRTRNVSKKRSLSEGGAAKQSENMLQSGYFMLDYQRKQNFCWSEKVYHVMSGKISERYERWKISVCEANLTATFQWHRLMANKVGNWPCADGAQNDVGLVCVCVCQLAWPALSSLNEVWEVVGHNASSDCFSHNAKNLSAQVRCELLFLLPATRLSPHYPALLEADVQVFKGKALC